LPAHGLRLRRVFPADPVRVFRAWTDPADLARWAWGTLGSAVTASADPQPGGAFQVRTARPDGTAWSFSGDYLEVAPARRLVHTLKWDAPMGYPPAPEVVSIEFAACPGGTEVLFVHDGVPDRASRNGHARGWENTFDTLAALLEAERATAAE